MANNLMNGMHFNMSIKNDGRELLYYDYWLVTQPIQDLVT